MDKNSKFKAVLGRIIKTIAVPIIIYLLFTILSGGTFGNGRSLLKLFSNSCYGIVLSWSLMVLWWSGLYDMSIGAVMLLGCIIGGNISQDYLGGSMASFIICVVVACILLSSISGLIHTLLNLPAMVISFGLTMGYEALTQILFNKRGVKTTYYQISSTPWCFIILAVAALVVIGIYYFTKIGNHMNAMGNSSQNAKSMGINLRKTKFISFVLSGILVGIAAVMFLSKQATITSVQEMASMSYTFNAIMAVFIGMFLTVYSNQIIATAIGTLIINMLNMGMLSLGMSATAQNITTGLFLLLFMMVSINQFRFLQYFKDRKRAKSLNAEA